MLGWKLEDIEKNIKKIKDQVFDNIQINPIQPLKEKSLENLCNTANKYNVKIISDIICNYMSGQNNGVYILIN